VNVPTHSLVHIAVGLVCYTALLGFDPVRPVQSATRATGARPVQRITVDGNPKQHPAWSPDCQWIAFTLYRKGKVGVVQASPGSGTAASDSAGWKHITPFDEYPEYEPSWSPDGKLILFVHVTLSGTDGQLEIHTMNSDGSDAKRLITPAKRPAQDEHPSWSSDGKFIAFTSTRDGSPDIYRYDMDGGNLRRITNHPGIDSHPTWSPDSNSIAFTSTRFGNMEICVMSADGSNVRKLTDHPAMDYQPKWSPDGKWIAFTSTRDGDRGSYEIYRVRPDGTGLENLSEHAGVDKDPTWTPDSSQVTFVSNRDGRTDLYSVAVRQQ